VTFKKIISAQLMFVLIIPEIGSIMRLNATSVNGKWSPMDSETRLQDLTEPGYEKQGNGHAVQAVSPTQLRTETEENVVDYSEQDRLCAQLDRAQHDGTVS